ncbi:MAG: helix-turn-helix transcriptional regulator [Peptococcia bacterium]
MDKIKEKILKSKSVTGEANETAIVTTTSGTPTRYGKKLQLSPSEKLKLVESLTPREKETFYILLGGYSLKETAQQLNIGYSTVNTYQTAIYKKLNVNSRAELIINFRDMCETKEE